MRDDGNILIVGTTTDYIDWIERRSQSEAVFLTSHREREQAHSRHPAPKREILADLGNSSECLRHVQNYTRSSLANITSIACFDDESLPLAAFLAEELGLEFPSVESIRNCLDKHTAKQIWRDNGVPCPRAITVSEDLAELASGILPFPIVLKPHSDSGSKLVFLCHTAEQTRRVIGQIIASTTSVFARATAVAEELVSGTEFSCDFAVVQGRIQILRTARKCMIANAPMGTARAYILPAELSDRMRNEVLPDVLSRAAEALGITRSLCMVDFIVKGEEVFLLEISPRIGGDCLPHILFEAWGVDVIGDAIKFSRGNRIKPWLSESAPTVAGLRVFAHGAGKVMSIDTRGIDDDPRIISHNLHYCRGRTVTMPPEDYSSWLLGHVIFQPYASGDIEGQIRDLNESIRVHIAEATP